MKEIKTNDGKKGGWLVGKRHYDKSGKSLGGIKAIVTDAGGKPVELEGGEVIINREASKKYWKELSKINQSEGNGVAIGPPSGFDEDPEDNYENGGKIDFNPNHIPNKWILSYAEKIKANQVVPEKIDVKVIKDDEDQYFARIDASKSKLADSVTVEKAPVMIPQLNEGGVDWFPAIMIPLQIVILILYGVYGEYQPASALDVGRYPYYQVCGVI